MTYDFLPEAQLEFWEAAERYESKEAGLGVRLRAEVAHVIERIAADPYLWRERSDGCRRVNCPVFPYYIAYSYGVKRYWLRRWRTDTGNLIIGRRE